jgi:hypothetical protein
LPVPPLVLSLEELLPVLPLPMLPPVEPVDESEGAGVAGVDGVMADDGDAGAGVLTGAESLGAVEVAGVGVWSGFLQPPRAANTTAVANTVLRIIIGTPFVVNNILTSVRMALCR